MYDIAFEKAKGRSGTINRTSLYGEAHVRKTICKRCYEEFPLNYKKTSVPKSTF